MGGAAAILSPAGVQGLVHIADEVNEKLQSLYLVRRRDLRIAQGGTVKLAGERVG